MFRSRRSRASTNDGMIDDMVAAGTLRTRECIKAFREVDRGDFWPSVGDHRSDATYADMPLRQGSIHLSAPHIYAKALESFMPLRQGMSFLNIGAGTGYFSSIVSGLIGDEASNDGVDLRPECVRHARRCCAKIGKTNITFTVGNVYQLDIDRCMRYDRIYVGACANVRAKYFYKLLEVGGVLIGPFQTGHSQHLRRVVRHSETHFTMEVLYAVQFSPLVEPSNAAEDSPPSFLRHWRLRDWESCPWRFGGRGASAGARAAAKDGDIPTGLPGVPFTFALQERAWSLARNPAFPSAFRATVELVSAGRAHDGTMPMIPPELWLEHILPFCSRCWFACCDKQGAGTKTASGAPKLLVSRGLRSILAAAAWATGNRFAPEAGVSVASRTARLESSARCAPALASDSSQTLARSSGLAGAAREALRGALSTHHGGATPQAGLATAVTSTRWLTRWVPGIFVLRVQAVWRFLAWCSASQL